MSSSMGILLAIYAAGAVVGLLCWLPYYLSMRRGQKEWRDALSQEYDDKLATHDKLVAVRTELASTADDLSRVEADRDGLKSRVAKLQTNISALDGEKNALSAEIENLTGTLTAANQNVERLEGDLKNLESEFERRKTEWNARRIELETQLADAQTDAEQLRGQIATLTADAERMIAEHAEALAALQQTLDDSNERLDQTRAELANVLADLDRQRLEWQEARVGLENQLHDAQQKVADLQRELTDHHEAKGVLSKEWDDARQSLEANLQSEKSRSEDLGRQFGESQSRVEQLTQDRDRAAAELTGLKSQYSEIQQVERSLREEIDRLAESAKSMVAKNGELTAHNETLQQQIDSLAVQLKTPARNGQQPAILFNGSPKITIGLDFGTHSTKVVFRGNSQANKSWVLHWDEPATGYPRFAAPSLMRMDDGRLYFGSQALAHGDGKLFRSLKRDLAAADRGMAPVLAALYLAWVLRSVRGILQIEPSKIALNVGAPMKGPDDDAIRDVFLHVVQAAWELAFGDGARPIENGVAYDDLVSQVRELLDKPIADDRAFDVCPESLCPLVSLGSSGVAMIVDMGAKSTECTIAKIDAQSIECLASESIALGGEQFIENDATAESLDAHAQRESELIEQFVKQLGEIRDRTLSGESEDKGPSRLFKVGGGVRRGRIEKALAELERERTEWLKPAELAYWDESLNDLDADLSLLGVAHGLSVDRKNWPSMGMAKVAGTLRVP